jgi:hypothetical protein
MLKTPKNSAVRTGSRETGVLPVRSAYLRKARDWIAPVSDEQLSCTPHTPIHNTQDSPRERRGEYGIPVSLRVSP